MLLDVAKDLEIRLRVIAEEREDDPRRLANDLLSHALNGDVQTRKPQPSADELLAAFAKLAETATAVRNYPDDFFSREVIYADHD